jgi:hydroxymethylpyrimidine/phosphomethylpyrimidine kinase
MKSSNKDDIAMPALIEVLEDFDDEGSDAPLASVMVFNANDASGAGGLAADSVAMASVGVHSMPVVTGAYVRDTSEIVDHFAFDDESVLSQASTIAEDVPPEVFKVGFVGTPHNLGAIASMLSDWADVPVVTYMPDLAWWQDDLIDQYQDACAELMLPQTTVLVGNHSTLSRWLLPEWSNAHDPSAIDIARAAQEYGVPYTLVTGINLPEQFIDNALCSATAVLCSEKFERLEATFVGAGDTLSATLAALIAAGTELTEAVTEALSYLDRSLEAGFRPGMGHMQPDRLFWAHGDDDELDFEDSDEPFPFDLGPNETRH